MCFLRNRVGVGVDSSDSLGHFGTLCVGIPMDIQYKVHLIQFIEFKVHASLLQSKSCYYLRTYVLSACWYCLLPPINN